MAEYTSKRFPNAYMVRNRKSYQGHPTQMSYSDKPITANIYQLILIHKDRNDWLQKDDDNTNMFTVIAEKEEDVLPIFDLWYYNFSQSAVPHEKYDIQINMVVRKIETHQLGIIQFSYRW